VNFANRYWSINPYIRQTVCEVKMPIDPVYLDT